MTIMPSRKPKVADNRSEEPPQNLNTHGDYHHPTLPSSNSHKGSKDSMWILSEPLRLKLGASVSAYTPVSVAQRQWQAMIRERFERLE